MKLTLVSVEPGLCRILADGMKVGHALAVWSNSGPHHQAWEAHLYASLLYSDIDRDIVRRLRLGELRDELRTRLAEKGPWWTA